MIWRDPDDQRRRMAERFAKCAEQVDSARGKIAWVKLSVEGNFNDEITGRTDDGRSFEGSVGEALDELGREATDVIERLDRMFDELRGVGARLDPSSY